MINTDINLTNDEFMLFKTLVYENIGISLNEKAKDILKNKLSRKLRQYKISSYGEYYNFIMSDDKYKKEMLNIITTNETYFFRENRQFVFLEEEIFPLFKNKQVNIWSAASSMGAEAYTIAMIAQNLNLKYKVLGSDINSNVILKANQGVYPLRWLDKIPSNLQNKYCEVNHEVLVNEFLISDCLKENTEFKVLNLMHHQNIGMFDIIFLRNVLIYFNMEVKSQVLSNIVKNLNVGGYLFISVTEHIDNLDITNLEQISSSIFRKVA
ncbi:MAG: protein-glutamate O-methyltransferase CheR [Epsilonproteobacteria bacterium]|nr:MAG: protein-glutamate O-methyltransferase CheR [Campylobacterota bacterium]